MGGEPQLAPPIPQGYAQTEDLEAGRARATMHKDRMDITQPGRADASGGIMDNIKDTILGD
jgi:hypothetical protein